MTPCPQRQSSSTGWRSPTSPTLSTARGAIGIGVEFTRSVDHGRGLVVVLPAPSGRTRASYGEGVIDVCSARVRVGVVAGLRTRRAAPLCGGIVTGATVGLLPVHGGVSGVVLSRESLGIACFCWLLTAGVDSGRSAVLGCLDGRVLRRSAPRLVLECRVSEPIPDRFPDRFLVRVSAVVSLSGSRPARLRVRASQSRVRRERSRSVRYAVR
jgi:hypothetical protein